MTPRASSNLVFGIGVTQTIPSSILGECSDSAEGPRVSGWGSNCIHSMIQPSELGLAQALLLVTAFVTNAVEGVHVPYEIARLKLRAEVQDAAGSWICTVRQLPHSDCGYATQQRDSGELNMVIQDDLLMPSSVTRAPTLVH